MYYHNDILGYLCKILSYFVVVLYTLIYIYIYTVIPLIFPLDNLQHIFLKFYILIIFIYQ